MNNKLSKEEAQYYEDKIIRAEKALTNAKKEYALKICPMEIGKRYTINELDDIEVKDIGLSSWGDWYVSDTKGDEWDECVIWNIEEIKAI